MSSSHASERRLTVEARAPDAIPFTSRTRVLLCDDMADMRLLMRLSLEQEPGFEIVGEADSGEATLSSLVDCEPDVALIDLSMPGMEGLELILRIRKLAPAVGIVVYSALMTPSVEARALDCGADRFLRKSAPLWRLREVTRDVARERDARERPPTPL